MATYDIGAGISEALGSIGQGLVTRKERKEEREKLIGQYEAIEDYKRQEYQDLLDKGAGENLVKAAQSEYEKWAKRGDELEDESTKKIEGIIAEYDKGEARKSRRLQNRWAELNIELAEETTPYAKQQKISEAEKAALGVQLLKDQQKERTALGEFRSQYGTTVGKPQDIMENVYLDPSNLNEPEVGTPEFYFQRDRFGNPLPAPPAPPAPRTEVSPDQLLGSVWDDEKGYAVSKSSPRGMEILGVKVKPDLGKYADMASRNAFGLSEEGELPPVRVAAEEGPLPESYYVRGGQRPSGQVRPPTAAERRQMSQDMLAEYAPRLGARYADAKSFAEVRDPMPTKGTSIEVDGEIVPGKVNVQGNILTIPRGQGLGAVPEGMRVKSINHGVDKDGNPTTSVSLERYIEAEQPEFVATAKMIADGDKDVQLVKELAGSAGQAKEFNDFYSDTQSSIQSIDEILSLMKSGREGGSDRPNWMDLSMPWPIGDRELQGMIQVRIRTLTGKLRLPLIGPGAVSEYEQKLLRESVADPTKLFSLTDTNIAKLKTLKSVMDRAIKVKGESVGLFKYGLKREPGLKPMTEAGAGQFQASFNSIAEANASGLPPGTEVGIEDPANLGRRKYVIPMSDAQRTAEIMNRP